MSAEPPKSLPASPPPSAPAPACVTTAGPIRPACPACGGPLMEVRAKLQCARCHTICETCCEGGRG